MGGENPSIEPYMLAVLSRRFDAITKEMANTLLRAGRSGVINTGHDFSCAIIDADCRVITVADASPCHIGAAGLQIKILKDMFREDIRTGDCFINTCAYYGNTHNGDFTIVAPVFHEGDLVFFTLSRAHQADIGAPIPTTYLPFAKTIQEEGIQLPCVRIQQNYEDISDLIRMCKTRIRVPEQWYGDYLAQVGSVRTGERRLQALCKKYGCEKVLVFLDEWQEYGARRMREEIRKFPRITLDGEGAHDLVPDIVPDGIPIRVRIDVDPDEEYITVDLTDNIDNVLGGFNLSEATVRGATLVGILHNVDPTVPHNEGAFSRIKIKLREGSAVGIPRYPVGTGLATTNVADRLTTVIESTFAKLGQPLGVAEGCTSFGAAPVISGKDARYNNAPYVNQLMIHGGGPALHGYDGWITYGVAQDNGVLHQDSVEVDELKYPIIFHHMELATDSGGDGQWRGAPAVDVHIRPIANPVTFVYCNDQHYFPAKGVLGGGDARPSNIEKYDIETKKTIGLPQMAETVFSRNELFVARNATGGGYGNPLDRDPELVRRDVREEIVSIEKAGSVYGVTIDTQTEEYCVDYEKTRALRDQLRTKRGRK